MDAASGETFESTSPATGETIGVFPRSGAEDVDRAVAAAKEAFADWRLVPAPKRGEILFRLARLLEQEKPALTDLMTREMGKVMAEAGGDVQEAIDITYYMAGEGRRLFGQTTPSRAARQVEHERPRADRRRRRDHAVELPDRDPVVEDDPGARLRQHRRPQAGEGHAALAERFVELLAEAGVPAGVVNIVHGGGESVGDALVRHPDVPRDHVHRLPRDRRRGAEGGGRDARSTSTSSSAARTRSSSWTTPTSTSRSTGSSGRRSARPASAAPRPRA